MADQESTEGAPVVLAIDAGVAVVRLNRPAVRNALDDEMRIALIDATEQVADDPEVRALVLTGSGSAFCAGGDIAAMKERLSAPQDQIAGNGWRRQRQVHRMVLGLHKLPKVTIAAVNGPAVGVGTDIALACDFIIASDAASFAMAHIRRGLLPDGGSMYFLPRRIGLPRAKELMLTGRKLAPEEAVELGFADRLVPAADLEREAIDWARQLSRNSPTAIALTKSIIDRTFELEAEALFALGAEAQALCYTTHEHRASVEAFLADERPTPK